MAELCISAVRKLPGFSSLGKGIIGFREIFLVEQFQDGI